MVGLWHVEVRLLLDGLLLWISLPEIGIGWVGRLLLLFRLLSSWLMGQFVDPMGLKVLQQPLTTAKRPSTFGARVRMFTGVNSHVTFQMFFSGKLLRTIWATKGRLSSVTPGVSQQMFLPCEAFAALTAKVRPLWFNALVGFQVFRQMLLPAVALGAALPGAVKSTCWVLMAVSVDALHWIGSGHVWLMTGGQSSGQGHRSGCSEEGWHRVWNN